MSFNLIKKEGMIIDLEGCILMNNIQYRFHSTIDWREEGLIDYLNEDKERVLTIRSIITKILSFKLDEKNINKYKFNPLWFNKDCIKYIMKRYGEMEINLE